MSLRGVTSMIACAGALSCTHPMLSAQKLSPKDRVNKIADAESLVHAGGAPWHLRMSFQLYDLDGKPTDKGTVEEWWSAPGMYRRIVNSPAYNVTTPGKDDPAPGLRREEYLVDLLVDQVADPIPHYEDFKNLDVTEGKRKFGKAELTCYDVLRTDIPSNVPQTSHPEFCVDTGMNDLRILFDSGYFTALRNRIGILRGVHLGLDNMLSYSGKPAINGHIDTLESFDPKKNPVEMTKPQANGSNIPGIVLAGKILRKATPVYPELAKQRRIGGTVILSAIISKEGKISSLEVVASPDESLSQSAIDAVKTWTYQPYLLNGEPTEVDTTITVNYNLNSPQYIFW